MHRQTPREHQQQCLRRPISHVFDVKPLARLVDSRETRTHLLGTESIPLQSFSLFERTEGRVWGQRCQSRSGWSALIDSERRRLVGSPHCFLADDWRKPPLSVPDCIVITDY